MCHLTILPKHRNRSNVPNDALSGIQETIYGILQQFHFKLFWVELSEGIEANCMKKNINFGCCFNTYGNNTDSISN